MSINANYFNTHSINSSRITSIKEGDRETATQMGLWDKFIDLFRSDKKQTALNALYDALHGEPKQQLEAFDLLQSCAKHADQSRFTKTIDYDGTLICRIDDTTIALFDSAKLKAVAQQVQTADDAACIMSMLPAEQQLEVFDLLQSCAKPADQSRFTKTIDADGTLICRIDDTIIASFDSDAFKAVARKVQTACDAASIMSMMPAEQQLDALRIIEQETSLQFPRTIDHEGMLSISLDGEEVSRLDLHGILLLNKEDVDLPGLASSMRDAEKALFFKILDVAIETDKQFEYALNHRSNLQPKVAANVYDLYRPEEKPNKEPTQCKYANLNENLEGLECLNAGHKAWHTQFKSIGYSQNQTTNEIEFNMVHPLISFLLGSYTNPNSLKIFEDFYKQVQYQTNAISLNAIKDGHKEYYDNKIQIDQKLKAIYEEHEGTLAIKFGDEFRNMLTLSSD